MIDQFLLTMCQKKRIERGYDILQEFKIIGFQGTVRRQK